MEKAIVAMLCITVIVCVCLLTGHNGVLVALGCSAVSGLGGFAIHKAKKS